MKEAQQRRWAKIRGEFSPPAPATPEAPKLKRKLNAAGRKAIQDALRRRWSQKGAEAAKATPKKIARKKVAAKNVAVKGPAKGANKPPAKKAANAPEQAAPADQ